MARPDRWKLDCGGSRGLRHDTNATTLNTATLQRSPPAAQPPVPRLLIALLALALLINYVDRGSIATAAPLLERELHLDASQLGWVLSAFFWAYVPLQPVMGWLADRIGAARVLAGGFAAWSVATLLTACSRGLTSLVGLRLLMGAGESVTYPSALTLLAQRVADRERARATAVMQVGAVLGPALGTLLGGWLMIRYGWRAMFLVLGTASLLWLLPWSRQLRANPPPALAVAGRPDPDDGLPTLRAILGQRALWGGMLGIFCSNYAFYFVFTWLPLYLVHERGLALSSMTVLTASFFLVDAASVLATGWLLDAWMAGSATPNRAYKTALAASAAGVGLCLLAAGTASPAVAAALLLLTAVADGLNSPATCAATQHFAGPHATGRWMGVQNAAANIAGIVAPVFTGYLVQWTGHYQVALWLAGAVALLGLGAWLLIVPPIEPVNWVRGPSGSSS
ncbi:MAG: MFS transporter [Proteobacteria bacterium]|nr:MFS transporter [Pseudomonadota bacterium]